ncbi:MAG: YihY/virulence factor BrkB family protein [Gemmatimonadales bacterium]|nr:MAG: YihY/virulence factor BrkB family protein [Gemmatimonadales bacterium]
METGTPSSPTEAGGGPEDTEFAFGPSEPPHLLAPRPHRAWAFLKRVLIKADEDAIFFMGGAISFNVLVAFVPLLLFTVGVSGMVLSARFVDPATVVATFLEQTVPAIRGDVNLSAQVRTEISALLAQGANLTLLGAALLVWFSTRLVGTLRTALKEIFDISQTRNLVAGKIYDIEVVLVGGLLFLLNLWLTAGVRAARDYGVDLLGLEGNALSLVQSGSAHVLAFLSIWVLFLGIYRYLPARRIPWRAALIAATFTAVVHEILKGGFGWYVTSVANYRTAYGNLISLAVLFFWIYYEALGFILGGEVAQVWTMRRARKIQIREVHGGGG